MNYNIHPDWNQFFEGQANVLNNIFNQIDTQPYYPLKNDVFNAFKISPKDIKVCLLGQDPYQNEGGIM